MDLRRIGDIEVPPPPAPHPTPPTADPSPQQNSRIDSAERRAREILRFSPLITDAYFHYTPSQIMLAALSLADRGLAERLIQETFHFVPPQPNSGAGTPMATDTPPASSSLADSDMATIIGPVIRDKVLGTVEACRDMLSKEPPERRDHWSSVRPPPFPPTPPPQPLTIHISREQKVTYKAQLQPIRKKLNKCRDPDRWNLVELQRSRREQVLNKAGGGGGGSDDGGEGVAGAKKDDDVFGGDAKRRKVAKGAALDDPFGGAL